MNINNDVVMELERRASLNIEGGLIEAIIEYCNDHSIEDYDTLIEVLPSAFIEKIRTEFQVKKFFKTNFNKIDNFF